MKMWKSLREKKVDDEHEDNCSHDRVCDDDDEYT